MKAQILILLCATSSLAIQAHAEEHSSDVAQRQFVSAIESRNASDIYAAACELLKVGRVEEVTSQLSNAYEPAKMAVIRAIPDTKSVAALPALQQFLNRLQSELVMGGAEAKIAREDTLKLLSDTIQKLSALKATGEAKSSREDSVEAISSRLQTSKLTSLAGTDQSVSSTQSTAIQKNSYTWLGIGVALLCIFTMMLSRKHR